MNTAPIKIKFADFWTEDIDEIFLYGFLKKYFRLELSDDPEVLVYSVFGNDHLNYPYIRILLKTFLSSFRKVFS